jgi:hypothetical protein
MEIQRGTYLEKTHVGASEIIERLWVGGFVPAKFSSNGTNGERIFDVGFDVWVACAQELQDVFDREACKRLKIVQCPLGDNYFTVSSPSRLKLIDKAVKRIVRLYEEGNTILITCAEGRNRSAMIAALVVKRIKGISGEEAVALVRKNRNPHFWNDGEGGWGYIRYKRGFNYVLTNETFEEYVKTEQPVDPQKFSQ